MKILAIMWDPYCNNLKKAGKRLKNKIEIKIFSTRWLEEAPERLEEVMCEVDKADVILLYRSSESIWEEIEKKLKVITKNIPIICAGHDPSYWTLSTVSPKIVATVNTYITYNGEENFYNMLRYIASEVCNLETVVLPPKIIPWEGIYHPKADHIFTNIEEYLKWYAKYKEEQKLFKNEGTIGILFSRMNWVNKNTAIEDALISKFEALGLSVIPVFSFSLKDEELGTRASGEIIMDYFISRDGQPRIDALVNLQIFLIYTERTKPGKDEKVYERGIEILKKLGVPVFTPITTLYKTIDEWERDPLGADGKMIGWNIAMPEFEGRIEPIIIGGLSEDEEGYKYRKPLKERIDKFAQRVMNWVKLRKIPPSERKVAFILHNNPCASVEATVGGGANLDTLESVARILQRMKEVGYQVIVPRDGKELITTIMNRKAISEFRWTTVEEIVGKGGVLAFIEKEKYLEWFNELPENVRKRMIEVWGEPPGEAKDGVPAAMVYKGKIVVTGVQYGQALVCVQPKRGCAGSRCDGRVCKILHDPDVPPPHQYIATYKWLSREFGVNAIVHVGTHGNLEFLPGKGAALSGACFPDIAIDTIPHLYIYNADNPPEGIIAKRRSYATLVDHMQTVMVQSGLYGDLEELEKLLEEYEKVKNFEPARTHVLTHHLWEILKKSHLANEIKISITSETEGRQVRRKLSELSEEEIEGLSFDEVVREVHNILFKLKDTFIQDGMHIFGEIPKGDRRVEFIYSILRYHSGDDFSLRHELAKLMGL
ncbi:MAG: cobaltochelatase subunit CobN, partial [Caldimicrobium sp.]